MLTCIHLGVSKLTTSTT